MTFHLTHTGYYAGQPICGGTKTPADQHPSYSQAGLERQLANCCQQCKALWLTCYEPVVIDRDGEPVTVCHRRADHQGEHLDWTPEECLIPDCDCTNELNAE